MNSKNCFLGGKNEKKRGNRTYRVKMINKLSIFVFFDEDIVILHQKYYFG
jgi:hypothetical protein